MGLRIPRARDPACRNPHLGNADRLWHSSRRASADDYSRIREKIRKPDEFLVGAQILFFCSILIKAKCYNYNMQILESARRRPFRLGGVDGFDQTGELRRRFTILKFQGTLLKSIASKPNPSAVPGVCPRAGKG